MVRIYNGLLPSKVHRFRSQRKLIASRLLNRPRSAKSFTEI